MCQKNQRILIVDDDHDILANLADILAEEGIQADTSPNGQDAMELLEKRCPDPRRCVYALCLLDFKMPGMDGVKLYQRMLDRNPRLRAIMMTAHAGADVIQRARNAGTWKILTKPVDIPVLLQTIREATAGTAQG
jgi:DNA-binding NtrC family response regulator